MTDPAHTLDNPTGGDPFAKPEQEFKDLIETLHHATPPDAVKTIAIDTVEGLKAEFIALEARFKVLVDVLEDKVHRGVINPAFAEAKKLVSRIVDLARAL